VSSCEICYEVYREWLCREMVPQVSRTGTGNENETRFGFDLGRTLFAVRVVVR